MKLAGELHRRIHCVPEVNFMVETHWLGQSPTRCEICKRSIEETFVDAATLQGPWMVLCLRCHECHGRGFGPQRGQLYERQPDGQWLKLEG
jgi:hypothetical protein